MILGIQIALLIVGLLALVRGRFNVGKERELLGGRARALGCVCMLPLPVAFSLGMVYGIHLGLKGVDVARNMENYRWHFVGIEVFSLVLVIATVAILGSKWMGDQEAELAYEKSDDPYDEADDFGPAG